MELARLGVRVPERKGSLERDGVGGVPQQPLAPVLQVEVNGGACRFERDRHRPKHRLAHLPAHDAALLVLGFLDFGLDPGTQNPGIGGDLAMGPAPQQLHLTARDGR